MHCMLNDWTVAQWKSYHQQQTCLPACYAVDGAVGTHSGGQVIFQIATSCMI